MLHRLVFNPRALACAALLGAAASTAWAAQSSVSWTTLKGSAPPWANKANLAGPADANEAVGFRVYLGWQDADGAAALASAVSDPRSASYRQYLTPAQFRNRFAPSQAQVGACAVLAARARASRSTTRRRTTTTSPPRARSRRRSRRSARRFGPLLRERQDASARRRATSRSRRRSPASSRGVVGLDDSAEFVRTDRVVDKNAPPSRGFRNAPPLSDYWAQLVSPYAYPDRLHRSALRRRRRRGRSRATRRRRSRAPTASPAPTTARARPWRSSTPTPRRRSCRTSISGRRNRGLPTMNASQLVQVVAPGTFRARRIRARIRRAGTARRRSTSRPSTAWRPARRSSTSARRTTTRTSTRR